MGIAAKWRSRTATTEEPVTTGQGETEQSPELTAAKARSVRFDVSSPKGYHFPQVEAFVASTTQTLERWEQIAAAHARTIHEMNTEAERSTYEASMLRSQIEVFRVQGDPLVRSDGSYARQSDQDHDGQAIMTLRAENESLRTENSRLQHTLGAATERAAGYAAEAAALRQANDQLSAQLATLATSPATDLTEHPAAEPVPVEHGWDEPAATIASDGDATAGLSLIPLSELEEGQVSPATGEAATTYPPTAPGVPLSRGAVPLTVWAPELAHSESDG